MRSSTLSASPDRAVGQGPFTYEALRPEDIVFRPLKQEREFSARELLEVGTGAPATRCSRTVT